MNNTGVFLVLMRSGWQCWYWSFAISDLSVVTSTLECSCAREEVKAAAGSAAAEGPQPRSG
jgi:hypothetical protein